MASISPPPYLWYSNQVFSQHFWSFFDNHGLGHAFQRGKAARLGAFSIRRHGARDALWRIDLLQQNGVDHRGRGLAYA